MKENRTGVYICWCGTNISMMVDIDAVTEEIQKLPDVAIAKNYRYMCSDPGQDLIVNDIKEHKLDRIVVAACSPRIHEHTFRKALQKAGVNPYMLEMANIREQNSWVHVNRDQATKKAVSLVIAAIKRVKWHEPLEKRTVEINPATLVIGGGIAGISASLELANAGQRVYLVEKKGVLGGQVANVDLTFPYFYSAQQSIGDRIEQVTKHPNIDVFLNSEIEEITGYIGNFETTLQNGKNKSELLFGNIVVATGLRAFDPGEMENYGYGKIPDVITSVEFEELLRMGKIQTKEGKEPKNIAIIHCVGSRNKNYHEYCSRTCCMTALKYVNQIRSALPDTHIFDLYSDMRAFGKGCEELYTETSKKNVMFLMFDPKNELPKIRKANAKDNCSLLIEMNEQLSGEMIDIPADMVILMVATEAHNDAKKVAHTIGVSLDGNSFFIEKHPKLDPVATTTDGVYIVGTCQSPKDIPDTVSQAQAAAARILSSIATKLVEVEATTAFVNEDVCCGCQFCIKVCPYSAIRFYEEKSVSVVNEILCKGCGTCGATCPSGAIRSKHFTDQQILSQINGLFSSTKETMEV